MIIRKLNREEGSITLTGSWEEFSEIMGNPESQSLDETVEVMNDVWKGFVVDEEFIEELQI